jgi:hypothetical protein
MKRVVVLLLFACALQAQHMDNDASCDISVAPAATLLLPYFEVEIAAPLRTTLFTVTNVSSRPQVAHITLFTDYAYPVLSFNLYLTPYDAQPINLYDVLVRGVIAADAGPPGTACARLATEVPKPLQADVLTALIIGKNSTCPGTTAAPPIGSPHATMAVGYATIDVVRDCTSTMPTSEAYFRDELLFDNVLIGEYQTFDPGTRAAVGGPMVHIRAIPEGGPAGSPAVPTALPYTFYTRYLGNLAPGFDRRQPLPSSFAARFVQSSTFHTRYKIWREGARGGLPSCAGYRGTNQFADPPTNTTAGNSFLPFTEVMRWDEHGNAFDYGGQVVFCPPVIPTLVLPSASSTLTTEEVYPSFAGLTDDVAGWMYLNLDTRLVEGPPRPSQSWVVVSMSLPGLYEVDFDAAWMGNGCTPARPLSEMSLNGHVSPAGGVPVCPPNSPLCRPGIAPYTGRN